MWDLTAIHSSLSSANFWQEYSRLSYVYNEFRSISSPTVTISVLFFSIGFYWTYHVIWQQKFHVLWIVSSTLRIEGLLHRNLCDIMILCKNHALWRFLWEI
jgi:hypothetical protein